MMLLSMATLMTGMTTRLLLLWRIIVISPENKSYKLIENQSHPNLFSIDLLDEKKSVGQGHRLVHTRLFYSEV